MLLIRRNFARASMRLKVGDGENPAVTKKALKKGVFKDSSNMTTKQATTGVKSRPFEDISNRRRPSIENPQVQKKAKQAIVEEKPKGFTGIQRKSVKKPPTPARRSPKKKIKSRVSVSQITIPKPTVVQEEARYDLSTLSGAIDNLLCHPPEGVQNVDTEERDIFYNPDYAQDIIAYLMTMEGKYSIPDNFLSSGQVTPNMRAVLVDWLIQLQNYLDLEQETLHMAASMLDQVLCREKVSLAGLQLAGVTCLFIACKFSERFTPELSTLVMLTDKTYTEEQVMAMERKVLKILCFDINMPLATTFLDRYVKVSSADKQTENMARYLLDTSLHDYHSLRYSASMKAAASLCLAGQIWTSLEGKKDAKDMKEEPWDRTLHYYSSYTEQDLLPCMQRLARLLVKSDQSKYKGAHKKYSSTSHWKAISLTPHLTTCYIVHELTTN